jgi:hypothetical protein
MKREQAKRLKLLSIAEEAAACRKAFQKVQVGAFVLHCHHEVLGEKLREPAENRIVYILQSKSQHEQALRLRLFRPVSDAQLKKFGLKAYADRQKAYADWQKADADWQKADADRQKAYADWQKADADRQKAYADWQKADADWQKADADRQKAYADWQKADADRQKACADWQKAYADRQKAYADWQKAYADWQKAYADWQKADADRQKADADLGIKMHKKVCHAGCPWDGRTIFPGY